MKQNDNKVVNAGSISARKAELQARLDSYFNKVVPLQERLYIGRYGSDTIKEPDELPPGVQKSDLRKRNVMYRGPMSFPDGRGIYLFVVREKDGGDWGTSIAIDSNEQHILDALDRKLASLRL